MALPCHSVHYSYNTVAGVVTIPPGGAGQYYFSTYLQVAQSETAQFRMFVNGNDVICAAAGDQNSSGTLDMSTAACSGVVELQEGG